MVLPGYALHEMGLQRQLGVDTLVSNQERRAAVVPRINRGSTAGFDPPSVYIGFPLFVLPETRPGSFCGFLCGNLPILTSRFSCPAFLKLKVFSTSRSPLRLYF